MCEHIGSGSANMMLSIVAYFYITFNINWTLITCTNMSVFDYLSRWYGAGEGYGTEWMFFPDGDGVPHYVSLTGAGDKYIPQLRSGFNNIEYRLYVRNNVTECIVLNGTAEADVEIGFDLSLSELPLKLITHGWRSSAESQAIAAIKSAYLAKQNVNVITVDWSYVANSIMYYWVANQTDTIGGEIAAFINALSTRHNVSGAQIHLIGHSLGAHIMGIAAFHSHLTVDRITGLDPARPLFEYPSRDDSAKLDSGDATFVDVIHTCGGVLGIQSNVGTADFFPNSGIPPQPGCETISKILEACSHGRSYLYYAESITNPTAFPAERCATWLHFLDKQCDGGAGAAYMGEHVGVARDTSGQYYLTTNSMQPFGRSQ